MESLGVHLKAALAPFDSVLSRPDVTDIYVNRPGELWVEDLGGSIERVVCDAISELGLARLARQVAAFTHQGISREHPLLSASLPDGSRVQFVVPPATRRTTALAIRKQVGRSLRLVDFAAAESPLQTDIDHRDLLRELVLDGKFAEAISLAVRSRKNIVISGATSSGKTTFLNALLREVPRDERLIFIEDTPEIEVTHENSVGLVAVRGNLGESGISVNDLVSASLRMRPDRIVLGELRGPEAFGFLRAVNSGHPGSMTTIHADSPQRALEQLTMLVLLGGTTLSRSDVHQFVRQSIDLVVQLGRRGGRRSVEAVTVVEDRLQIAGES
jgi:type IV secretion system protein VirB11